jgi:hypothetical protein
MTIWTVTDLRASRDAAGAAYVAAVAAYYAAWVNLAGHDMALDNKARDNAGYFAGVPPVLPGHKNYPPALPGDIAQLARARHDELLANFS